MSLSLLSTIAINLGILLVASWVIFIVIILRVVKDKEAIEDRLQQTKQKLKDKKINHQKQAKKATATNLQANYPLEPVITEESSDSLNLLEAISDMSINLVEKEQQLAMLGQLHTEQQQLLEQWQESNNNEPNEEVFSKHQETQVIIDKLKHDQVINQRVIELLETKLRDGTDKDGRIAVLEETEKRLKERVEILKQNNQQAAILAEGLRKANEKKQALTRDNDKLKRNIKELSNASQEQLATINKISLELEKVTNLEQHQRNIISSLEVKLQSEKTGENDTSKVAELEGELQNLSETLDRTLREKEFIESYILEMDKTLEQSKETEEALERAQKEIATLEMYFPEFENTESTSVKEQIEETHEVMQKLLIDPDKDPELHTAIIDNRLFGILQEFWMTLDTPPLQLISESDIARPKDLEQWLNISIKGFDYFITIGSSRDLTQTLTKAMFKENNANDDNIKDAFGELGNVMAGTLANELNSEFSVGISEHIAKEESEENLLHCAVAAEILVKANNQSLYIALVKNVE